MPRYTIPGRSCPRSIGEMCRVRIGDHAVRPTVDFHDDFADKVDVLAQAEGPTAQGDSTPSWHNPPTPYLTSLRNPEIVFPH